MPNPPAYPSNSRPPTAPAVQQSPVPTGEFDRPTYHRSESATKGPPEKRGIARSVTRKVITASTAKGAGESGLSHLIWNQVLSYGADAMVTVALAGTVFFGASPHAQRGNVLLYLLVTMAPFALIAPVIGPALDRFQHGRRWAMGASAIGRGVLALIMAGHPTNLLVLYPCALGSLVLSKAYSVVRAAAAPRLVPPGMTFVEANARLSVFGLASALIGGGLVAGVIKVSGSYTAGLVVTAVGFGICAFFAFRLPKQVDSAPGSATRRRPSVKLPRSPSIRAVRQWAQRGLPPQVITSLQGEATLRFLSGLLTVFLAFYIETTSHGFTAALALAGLAGAAGPGQLRRHRHRHPDDARATGADHHHRRRFGGGVCLLTARAVQYLARRPGYVAQRGCQLAGQDLARLGHPARRHRDDALERVRPLRDVPAAGMGPRRSDRRGASRRPTARWGSGSRAASSAVVTTSWRLHGRAAVPRGRRPQAACRMHPVPWRPASRTRREPPTDARPAFPTLSACTARDARCGGCGCGRAHRLREAAARRSPSSAPVGW